MQKKNYIRIGSILTGLGLILTLIVVPIDLDVNIWAGVGLGLILFGVMAVNIAEWGIKNGATKPTDSSEEKSEVG